MKETGPCPSCGHEFDVVWQVTIGDSAGYKPVLPSGVRDIAHCGSCGASYERSDGGDWRRPDGGVKVRRLGVEDVEILRELRLRALRDAPDAFWTTYEDEVAQEPEDWGRWLASAGLFVAEDGAGTAIGMAGGMDDPADPAAAVLVSMWVAPEHRGSGLADQLVSAVATWATSEGRFLVRLHVEERNDRARRCYERLGFVYSGRGLVRPRDGRWELEMERHEGDRPS